MKLDPNNCRINCSAAQTFFIYFLYSSPTEATPVQKIILSLLFV